MFNRLDNEKLLQGENPAARIKKLKTDESKVKTFTDKQVRRLFAQIDKETFPGYRDYCALLTMLKCGLRINEINALEIKDIDFDNEVIVLPGSKNKNRRTRVVPMTKKVSSVLKQLITETKSYFNNDNDYVFVNNEGEMLRDDLIRKRMYEYGKKANLHGECKCSPHTLRHTFAVNFLKNTGDIRALQLLLGHSELATTEIYLNYSDQDIKEKYKQAEESDLLDL